MMTAKPINLARVRELQQLGYTLSAAIGMKPAFGPEGMKIFSDFRNRAQEFSRADIQKDFAEWLAAFRNLVSAVEAAANHARTAADPDERKVFQGIADQFRSVLEEFQALLNPPATA